MLTTIDQRKPQLAEAAVGLMMQLLSDNPPGEYTHRVIRPALIERSTCAPFDRAHALRSAR